MDNYNNAPPVYNKFQTKERTRGPRPIFISEATQAAFDELRVISSWEEFGRVCTEQKRKRGY